jgi:hypothetical protein
MPDPTHESYYRNDGVAIADLAPDRWTLSDSYLAAAAAAATHVMQLHTELGPMFGLDDADAIAAELRSRGARYHLSAGGIYANAADARPSQNLRPVIRPLPLRDLLME